jgi:hypothetical protein
MHNNKQESFSICLSRFRWQRTARGMLIYDTLSDAMFKANDTALEILQLFAAGGSCQRIAENLVVDYGLSMDAILGDVQEFLSVMPGWAAAMHLPGL